MYRRKGDIERFVEEKEIKDSERLLIQVFTGIPEREHILGIQEELKGIFTEAGVIGTTTGGEVFKGEVLEGSTVLSFTTFEKASVRTHLSEGEGSYENGVRVAEALKKSDTKLFILFADGLYTNGDEIVRAFNELASSAPMAGGLAGDNFTFRETFVFTLQELTSRGVVGASLQTDRLYITSHYNLAWYPVGKEMIVTRASGNRIYEIDGKPVVAVYREYLGADAEEHLPHVAIEFPLVFERDGVLLARACLGVNEDGSMSYEGSIREGEVVSFSVWDTGVMLESAAENLKKFRASPSESIFVYTCLGRKYLMGKETEVEVKYLQSVAPTSGFLTYGEFFTLNGKNMFMNYTHTALSISEADRKSNTEDCRLEEDLGRENVRFRALVSLIDSVTRELREANKELEKLAERDELTGLYNRRKAHALMEEQLIRSRRYGEPFCVLMVDIDNFKSVNDAHGHQRGDEVLVELAAVLKNFLRESDISSRWGGEEFLILLPATDLEGGVAVAEKLRIEAKKAFEDMGLNNVSLSIGVSSFRSEDTLESLLSRADRAMYIAKKRGKNLVEAY
ncbi:sensor domain-containing diguanylate cyclase [Hydrogenivirga sp.]